MNTGDTSASAERVRIIYSSGNQTAGTETELPFKILVLGDFTAREEELDLQERQILAVDCTTMDDVLRSLHVHLALRVPNKLQSEAETYLNVQLSIESMADFTPDAVVQQIPELAALVALRKVVRGVQQTPAALWVQIRELVTDEAVRTRVLAALGLSESAVTTGCSTPFIAEGRVDTLCADIDRRLSAQVNAILHDTGYQQLEAAWRSLEFLLQRVDTQQNMQVHLLSVSRDELRRDFEDSLEIVKSGLYKQAYISEFGQFGGQPFGCLVGNYAFGPGPQDLQLLQKIAAVAAMAHAPFLAAADKSFFGIAEWEELPNLQDIHSVFDMPQYARWKSFRALEDARYVGLTLPGFLLRQPYGTVVPRDSGEKRASGASSARETCSFHFEEVTRTSHDFCWGSAAFALAACMAGSFARYRWCVNIVGPDGGGAVEGLPVCQFSAMGRIQSKPPVQVLVSERREFALATEGFIALTMRNDATKAVFYSANAVQMSRHFAETAEGREAEMNFKLSIQLPYMMIMNRLAHYIKVIQRENIGLWKERLDLENELNKWIGQYVTAMDNPDAITRSRRPLRMAHIEVREIVANAGWYALSLRARPHFTYMGVNFTLALLGKLDKE